MTKNSDVVTSKVAKEVDGSRPRADGSTLPETKVEAGIGRPFHPNAVIDAMMGVGLSLAVFALYLRTLAPTVADMFSDTLEFQLVPYQLGIAHPTGYPLYTLLGKLATFLPISDVAFRLNLMSAFWGAAASGLVYAIVLTLTPEQPSLRNGGGRILSQVGGIIASLFLATSPIFWSQAIVAEVYSLNVFLILLFVWTAFLYRAGRLSMVAPAFAAGLGLTHHRSFALFIPAVVLFFWLDRRGKGQGIKVIGRRKGGWRIAAAFLIPLFLYAYLPWRGMNTSSLDGAYRNSFAGFLDWVTGRAYTVFLADNPWHQASNPLSEYLQAIFQQFGFSGILLGVFGSILLCWRDRVAAAFLIVAFVGSAGFAVLYRVADVEPFYLPSIAVVSLSAGMGGYALLAGVWLVCQKIRKRNRSFGGPLLWTSSMVFIGLLLGFPLAAAASNLMIVDKSEDRAVREYGEEVFSLPMPPNSAIVSLGGENTLFRYLQETEGKRQDLVLVRADSEPDRRAIIDRLVSEGRSVYTTHPLAGLAEKYPLSSLGSLIAIRSTPVSEIPANLSPAKASFGTEVQLLGLQPVEPAFAGSKLRLVLFWRALDPHGDRTVYVHLLDSDGNIVAQSDQRPLNGAYPTSLWRKGEVIADTHDLPLPTGLPPGEYRIVAGLFESATGQPIVATTGEKTTAEGISLGDASVWRPVKAPSPKQWPKMRWSGNAASGDGLALIGVDWDQGELRPGSPFGVIMLWRATGEPTRAHQFRLRLLAADTREDRSLLLTADTYPTDRWTTGEIVRLQQRPTLPPDLPNGLYQMSIGLDDGALIQVGSLTVKGRDKIMKDPTPAHPAQAKLGQLTTLTGFDLTTQDGTGAGTPLTSLKRGTTLRLVLHWQVLTSDPKDLKVFVHLLSADGHLIAQDDSQPMGGAAPTSGWTKGEFILDEHRLSIPDTAATGEARLIVGMYEPASGERLRTETADSILLKSMTVE